MAEINPELWEEVTTATALTEFARGVIDEYDTADTLGDVFPTRTTEDIEYEIRSTTIVRRPVAEFRTYDAASPTTSGDVTGTSIVGELPPISIKERLGEYDRLRLRGVTNDDRLVNSILNPTGALVTQIADRVEVARGQALSEGQITMDENGIDQAVIDFNRAAGLSVTVGTLWDVVSTATPADDLMTHLETYEDENGFRPGSMLMSSRIYRYLLQSDTLRDFAIGATQGALVSRLLPDQANTILANLGVPPIRIFNRKVNIANAAGVVTLTPVIPDNEIIFLPPTPVGPTLYGVTADALEIPGLTSAQPGIVASTSTTWDPVAKWTKASAIVLPMPGDGMINATAKLTVLA